MIYLWAILAAAVAVGIEAVYRRAGGFVLWAAPGSILVSFLLAQILGRAPSYVTALATFGAATTGFRIVTTLVVFRGELSWRVWIALVLLVAASLLKR